MPGKRVACHRRFRVMTQRERRHVPRFVNARHPPGVRRVSGAHVVIAAHQHNVETPVTGAPFLNSAHGRGSASTSRMQQIAEHNESLRTATSYCCAEPFKVGDGRSLRRCNCCCTECARLANVRIGNDQRGSALPEKRTLREQPYVLPRERAVSSRNCLIVQHRQHARLRERQSRTTHSARNHPRDLPGMVSYARR
jgi:hypothetical protein